MLLPGMQDFCRNVCLIKQTYSYIPVLTLLTKDVGYIGIGSVILISTGNVTTTHLLMKYDFTLTN